MRALQMIIRLVRGQQWTDWNLELGSDSSASARRRRRLGFRKKEVVEPVAAEIESPAPVEAAVIKEEFEWKEEGLEETLGDYPLGAAPTRPEERRWSGWGGATEAMGATEAAGETKTRATSAAKFRRSSHSRRSIYRPPPRVPAPTTAAARHLLLSARRHHHSPLPLTVRFFGGYV